MSAPDPCCHELRKISPCHSDVHKTSPSAYFQGRKAVTGSTIDDAEFIIDSSAVHPRDSMVEQNMYQILHDHNDVISAKCLEAKLPILKQSLYKKDFVPKPFGTVIRGAANNPWEIFKDDAKLPINSLHRVSIFSHQGRLCEETDDPRRAQNQPWRRGFELDSSDSESYALLSQFH